MDRAIYPLIIAAATYVYIVRYIMLAKRVRLIHCGTALGLIGVFVVSLLYAFPD